MRAEARRRRLLLRWLGAACLLAAIVIWNLRFDAAVRAATHAFVAAADARAAAASGPPLEMAPFMRSARRRAAAGATRVSALPAVIGLVVLAFSRRAGRAEVGRRPQTSRV